MEKHQTWQKWAVRQWHAHTFPWPTLLAKNCMICPSVRLNSSFKRLPKLIKPLSHQGGVLTATAGRARKTQNAELRAVRSPRAPRDRRGISTGRRGVSQDTMPRRALCACTKCALWLGVPTAIWMSAVWTPWVRSGNAVTAQWGLLGCHEDAVRTQWGRIWSPQERRHLLQ